MENVTKCRHFLITLIQLAQRNYEQTNPQTVQNVKDLVQQLIDDRIPAQTFTERLQTELQSTPQVIFFGQVFFNNQNLAISGAIFTPFATFTASQYATETK